MRLVYTAIDQTVPGAKGGSTHVSAVASGLARLGHEVHVATTRGVGPAPDSAVHWHAIGAPLGRPHLRLLRAGAVRRLVERVAPDAVIERYHNFGGEGLLAARRTGASTVLEVNAPVVDYTGSPKRRLDRALLVEPMRRWRDWQCRHADLIVTPLRSILPAFVEPARVLEAEWGADTTAFRPDAAGRAPFERGEGEIVVVFAGAFRAWHGAVHLVDAMARLEARGLPFRAVLIGEGPERPRVQERIAAHGLRRVTMVGAIPHAKMPAALAAADIGAAPFDVEAHAPLRDAFYWSPLKVFEYMASGLPVVAPDMPRLRALVGPDGEAGLLYDGADPAALAGAIERLGDASLRSRLAQSARARAVRLFSWDAHCRQLADAIAALRRR
jgi:glycosyltransferase involved in cell wall biosynthesis